MMFGIPAWQPGEMHLTVGPGSKVWLDADKTSGPDGDEVTYRWYPYREAGSFPLTIHYRNLSWESANPAILKLTAPKSNTPRTIHFILEAEDRGCLLYTSDAADE